MSYGTHVSLAVRYAALALTDARPAGADLPAVLVLRDDFAAALAELAILLADRHDRPDRSGYGGSVVQLAVDPAGALVVQLADLPRLGAGWEHRPPPSQRWSGRPRDPAQALTVLDQWKGLAVETTLAADTLQRTWLRASDPARWTALADVAALAEALSALDPPLIAAAELPGAARPQARESSAALGAAAREVAALAAGTRADDHAPARPHPLRPSVVIVSGLPTLPAAVDNLTRLIADGGAGAAGLHAAALALTRTSLAAAAALDSAARAPTAHTPDLLRATAAALLGHGTRIRHALETSAPNLATVDAGRPAVADQAREIVADTHTRIRDRINRPDRALAASPDLLEYAARLGPATETLTGAYTTLDRAGLLLSRDRSDRPTPAGWVPAQQLGTATPLLEDLAHAATAAWSAPTPPRPSVPEMAPTPAVPVADLRRELAARRAALRPDRPALPPRTVPPAAGVPSR